MLLVELLSGKIFTDYSANQVKVEYTEDLVQNKYRAELIDKETGEILEVYSETPEIPINEVKKINNNPLARSSSTYNTTWDQLATIMTIDGYKIQAYVWVRVNISAGSYWRQVNYVSDKGHNAGGSGDYSLNPAGTYVDNNPFPCGDKLQVDYNGIIEITSSNSLGLDIELLKGLNFSVSGSTNWTARKTYNKTTSFTVAV